MHASARVRSDAVLPDTKPGQLRRGGISALQDQQRHQRQARRRPAAETAAGTGRELPARARARRRPDTSEHVSKRRKGPGAYALAHPHQK